MGTGCCKLILLACACSISSTLGLPLLMMHTTQTLHCSTREPSEAGPRLHAPPRSKPLRLGTQEALRGTDLVGPAFCALPRSEQLRSLASAVAATYGLYLLLSFLGVPLASLLRPIMTVQKVAVVAGRRTKCRRRATPRPKSGTVARVLSYDSTGMAGRSHPASEVRGGGREELPCF